MVRVRIPKQKQGRWIETNQNFRAKYKKDKRISTNTQYEKRRKENYDEGKNDIRKKMDMNRNLSKID